MTINSETITSCQCLLIETIPNISEVEEQLKLRYKHDMLKDTKFNYQNKNTA